MDRLPSRSVVAIHNVIRMLISERIVYKYHANLLSIAQRMTELNTI